MRHASSPIDDRYRDLRTYQDLKGQDRPFRAPGAGAPGRCSNYQCLSAVRGLEFDVSEMAFSTYLCARACHKPMTALPVFLLRRFEHGGRVYNVKSRIPTPLDFARRR